MHTVFMVPVYLPTYQLFVEHDIRIIYFIFAKYHERVIVNIKGNQSPKRYGEQYRFSDKAKESLSFAKAFASNSFLYIFHQNCRYMKFSVPNLP